MSRPIFIISFKDENKKENIMTVVCCVCNKVKTKKGWVKQHIDESEELSHGYCPKCAIKLRLEIEQLKNIKLYKTA